MKKPIANSLARDAATVLADGQLNLGGDGIERRSYFERALDRKGTEWFCDPFRVGDFLGRGSGGVAPVFAALRRGKALNLRLLSFNPPG